MLNFFDYFNDYPLKSLGVYTLYGVLTKTPLIIVGNTGSGKSEIYNFLKANFKETMFINVITQASLKFVSQLSNYNGIVFIDDIGSINTTYMRTATMTTLIYLSYQHNFKRYDATGSTEIKNFNGSIIINIQPSVFDDITKDASFEANIMDKSYRYYNMRIPDTSKEIIHPKIKELQNIYDNFDSMKVEIDKRKVEAIANAFLNKMSPARRITLAEKWVKLTAILNGHTTAQGEDYKFVSKLFLNNIIEDELLLRVNFKSKFMFNVFLFNVMLLAKYYGNMFHYTKLQQLLGVSKRTIYYNVKQNNEYVDIDNGFIIVKDSKIIKVLKNVY